MDKVNYVIYGAAGVFGLYLLFLTCQMKISGKISDVILPKEDMIKIKDIEGYIGYTVPAMIGFSIVSILIAVMGCLKEAGFLQEYIPIPDLVLRMILLTIFLLGLGFFIYRMRCAKERF